MKSFAFVILILVSLSNSSSAQLAGRDYLAVRFEHPELSGVTCTYLMVKSLQPVNNLRDRDGLFFGFAQDKNGNLIDSAVGEYTCRGTPTRLSVYTNGCVQVMQYDQNGQYRVLQSTVDARMHGKRVTLTNVPEGELGALMPQIRQIRRLDNIILSNAILAPAISTYSDKFGEKLGL